MKKAMKIVLAMAMVLLMSGGAMAEEAFNAQGSAIVPHVKSYRSSKGGLYTSFYISNITNQNVRCKVDVYDQSGNNVSSYGDVWTIVSGQYQLAAGGDDVFDIPAYSTRYFNFTKSGILMRTMGYAVIKWNSNDPQMTKALVSTAQYTGGTYNDYLYGGVAYINNGQPF
ncbi:hypothetical protein [Maridesulfovibrio sp.]|uniref:hypothetical protein n=1 Tax=Maridesulfovibrio sp. TaxID=2795000 RepID=UPI002A187E48|nr:hypothetical protein [Maridesulfovibrio sp.]